MGGFKTIRMKREKWMEDRSSEQKPWIAVTCWDVLLKLSCACKLPGHRVRRQVWSQYFWGAPKWCQMACRLHFGYQGLREHREVSLLRAGWELWDSPGGLIAFHCLGLSQIQILVPRHWNNDLGSSLSWILHMCSSWLNWHSAGQGYLRVKVSNWLWPWPNW